MQIRTRTAKTRRGRNLISSKDVPLGAVQDKTEKMVTVGSDVEALYPSLDDMEVANIVYKAIMDSEIEFDSVDYLEGARYIAINWTAAQCKSSELRRVLPVRRHVNGTLGET